MKLTLTTLAALTGLTTAKDITTHSRMGQKLMSTARRVDTPRSLEANEEIDYTWVANYALKFQGCHNIPRWNEDADGEDDVRVSNTALVRFRLCPANSCSTDSAYGCKSGYGDYVVSMDTYLNAYFESVQQDQEYNCEYAMNYECNCADGGDDNYNEEMCQYDCFMNKGMEYCVDKNPYAEDGEEEEEKQDIREMAECQQFEVQNDDNNNNNNNNNGEQVEYFMGPHCSDDGSSIRMGLFTDDECTVFADSSNGATTYSQLTYGASMPYASTTMVGTECMSCKEPADVDQNNANDQADEDEVKEGCEQLYEASAKCEAGLSGTISYPDNSGCNFMQGIKIIRKNGNVYSVGSSKNRTATVFIGLFGAGFVLLAGYSYYLKTKLERAKINLSE
mmetsp:Transcript_4694/g.6872  ORF Transcript_4694/g.6872 Transcript_4694/m.6872 type:complete len:392 (+) Transcript_4694:136-1311(+)|eukprot:CAMPEP_0201687346 /NCGR_PEP_ID=MMETSP0578-20130828/1451_1 /ASSEMBLY_ACC=CAM_ASM_000663 /TAXON_ID=267565 /ORGANISM="Skeletonema grethea, Strain CCMP 1804" /LENGTH=391 /DNA_ID=CAMNT_0048171495 /DNA_START=71 /DNA_END=1246 /DNA_ORIENTATION=-